LAYEVTSLVHGVDATNAAILAAQALFGQADLTELDPGTLRAALSELPNVNVPSGAPVTQLLVDTGLTSSLGEARRAVAQGGVYVNNIKVTDDAATVVDALPGGVAVLRRGKKTLAGIFLEQ
jgi:tyrosyl-tRNA synthetase